MRFRNIVWTGCLLLAFAIPVSAQVTFPEQGMTAIDALYRGVDPKNDDARRVAIRNTCEQMSFFLGPRWGGKKRAGLSDLFRSPDSLAFLEDDSTISIWDVQSGDGAILVFAGKPPDHPKDSPDNSTFMRCDPIDHIGGGNPLPDPDPVPLPPADLADIHRKLDELLQRSIELGVGYHELKFQLDTIRMQIEEVKVLASRPFPNYHGRLFGVSPITLVPNQ